MQGGPAIIDFASRGRSPWTLLQILLVAASFVLAAGFAIAAVRTTRALELQQAILVADRDKEHEAELAMKRTLATHDTREINDAILALNVPWDVVFGALSAAQRPGIVVLSIEPDAARAIMVIEGNAPNLNTALVYRAALQEQRGIADVRLLSHGTSGASSSSIRFRVEARWRAEP
jgi:hypothetical protein